MDREWIGSFYLGVRRFSLHTFYLLRIHQRPLRSRFRRGGAERGFGMNSFFHSRIARMPNALTVGITAAAGAVAVGFCVIIGVVAMNQPIPAPPSPPPPPPYLAALPPRCIERSREQCVVKVPSRCVWVEDRGVCDLRSRPASGKRSGAGKRSGGKALRGQHLPGQPPSAQAALADSRSLAKFMTEQRPGNAAEPAVVQGGRASAAAGKGNKGLRSGKHQKVGAGKGVGFGKGAGKGVGFGKGTGMGFGKGTGMGFGKGTGKGHSGKQGGEPPDQTTPHSKGT